MSKTKNNGSKLTDNEKRLINLTSELMARSELAARAGVSFGDDRDLYKAFGWKRTLEFKDCWDLYRRGDIAKQIIDAPPNACWRLRPEIIENIDPKESTSFEKKWRDLVNNFSIYHYINRADKLSRVFEFSVMLVGIADGRSLERPLGQGELTFLRPYKQDHISIEKWVTKENDPRFGMPEFYRLTTSRTAGKFSKTTSTTSNVIVHHSRVLHLAEGLLEGDVFGTPQLESVFNMLSNLHLVAGSSGEMFYRGAFPGLAFLLDKEAMFDSTQALAAFEEEIEKYIHNLQRTMKLQGMQVENLTPQVADPKSHIGIYLDLIAGATRTPKRILIGTERGDLASTQDESAWNDRIDERRINYCEPIVLRKFISLLQQAGALPETPEGYRVKWGDISVPTEEEKVRVIQGKAKALSDYGNSLATSIVPPEIFLSEVMEFDDSVVKKIMDLSTEQMLIEEKRMKEEEKIMKKEEEEKIMKKEEEKVMKKEEEKVMKKEEEEEKVK